MLQKSKRKTDRADISPSVAIDFDISQNGTTSLKRKRKRALGEIKQMCITSSRADCANSSRICLRPADWFTIIITFSTFLPEHNKNHSLAENTNHGVQMIGPGTSENHHVCGQLRVQQAKLQRQHRKSKIDANTRSRHIPREYVLFYHFHTSCLRHGGSH